MKRIITVLAVAALMAVMLVAMASAALAVPPASGRTGCDGGLTNANHAVFQSSPSFDATFDNPHVTPGSSEQPANSDDAPGTQDNRGLDTARNTGPIGSSSNCR